MFAKQARLLHNDGLVEEAKDLFVNALALLLFAGTSPTPVQIPVRARRGADSRGPKRPISGPYGR
jgi:hypothetical protein